MPPSDRLVTICLPTFNRAPMLTYLFEQLAQQITPEIAAVVEIVVSDNASPDNTGEVVERFSDRLPLRYVRRERNLGSHSNFLNAGSLATTPYITLCADDDLIDLAKLVAAARKMESDPAVGAAYYPVLQMNALTGRSEGYFSPGSRAGRLRKGQYAQALNTVLDQHAFPEIAIWRRELLPAFPPVTDSAYFFFVLLPTILKGWDIVFGAPEDTFYTFFIRHPLGPREREQTGRAQTKMGWETYRGGLEFMLFVAQAENGVALDDLTIFRAKIDRFVTTRQEAALHLNVKDGAYTFAYYLARRLMIVRPDRVTQPTIQALRVAGAAEQAYIARFGSEEPRRAAAVGRFPAAFEAMLKRYNEAWLSPHPPAEGVPTIGWNLDQAPDADLHVEPYLAMFPL